MADLPARSVTGCWPAIYPPLDTIDNAVTESFFATYKKELAHTRSRNNLTEVRQHKFPWIEGHYNRRRRHSTLNYLTPLECELGYMKLTDPTALNRSIKSGTLHLRMFPSGLSSRYGGASHGVNSTKVISSA